MFVSPAWAQGAGGGGLDGLGGLLPLVLIFVVFYFLLIRPQQKKAKEHREMLGNVRRNDKIVTNGGLVGTVIKVSEGDDLLTVEIASGVKVQVVRSMIADVRTKGQPVSSKAPANGKAAKTVEADNDDEDDAETPKSAT